MKREFKQYPTKAYCFSANDATPLLDNTLHSAKNVMQRSLLP